MAGLTPEIYGRIGRELAAFVANGSGRTADSQVLPSVVADLAGSADALIAPLKDLVGRPGFAALAVRAGSRSGAIQRDALLHELKAIYSPQVVEGLTDLLNAFLDLPPGPESPPCQQPLILSESVPEPPPPQTITPVVVPAERPQAPAPERRTSRWPLVVSGLLASALAAAAGVLMRQPPYCDLLRLCPQHQAGAVNQAVIDQARRSAVALRTASALSEMKRSLAQLQLDLRRIDLQTLTPQQAEEVKQLEALANQTRELLALEAGYKRRREQASRAITAARSTQDPAAGPGQPSVDGASSRDASASSPEPAEVQGQQPTLSPQLPPPQLPPAPAPAPAPTLPSSEARSRTESALRSPGPPAAPSQSPISGEGSSRYSLPPQWEERRARRREILNQYR